MAFDVISLAGGMLSGVQNVQIKAFPCPKINDVGVTTAWNLASAVTMAGAVAAAQQSAKSADEEYKIAKRYYNLAKEQWDYFRTFYAPLEREEAVEIWSQPPYTPDYSSILAGFKSVSDIVFGQANRHQDMLARKYSVCIDKSIPRKTRITQATIEGDLDNFARRYAEKWALTLDDTRWQRVVVAIGRGRGLLNQSATFAAKAANLYDEYSNAMGGLAGQAAEFSGYLETRRSTEYNPDRYRINPRAVLPDLYNGNNLDRMKGIKIFEDTQRGGLNYGTAEGIFPYVETGIDPVGYAGP